MRFSLVFWRCKTKNKTDFEIATDCDKQRTGLIITVKRMYIGLGVGFTFLYFENLAKKMHLYSRIAEPRNEPRNAEKPPSEYTLPLSIPTLTSVLYHVI